MKCPRCNEKMETENVEGEDLLVCRGCGGMWAHRHQLNHLLKESGGDVESCSIDDNPHEDRTPVVKCVVCGDIIMKKINFLDYSDIIIDYCPSCGAFFLDRDELSGMHRYVKEVDEGSHQVRDWSAYNLLVRLSEIAYRIFH